MGSSHRPACGGRVAGRRGPRHSARSGLRRYIEMFIGPSAGVLGLARTAATGLIHRRRDTRQKNSKRAERNERRDRRSRALGHVNLLRHECRWPLLGGRQLKHQPL